MYSMYTLGRELICDPVYTLVARLQDKERSQGGGGVEGKKSLEVVQSVKKQEHPPAVENIKKKRV